MLKQKYLESWVELSNLYINLSYIHNINPDDKRVVGGQSTINLSRLKSFDLKQTHFLEHKHIGLTSHAIANHWHLKLLSFSDNYN